jgi:hypothetical protein
MLKDIKHDRIRKLEKTSIVSVNLHAFFTNMVAEKLWNKKF